MIYGERDKTTLFEFKNEFYLILYNVGGSNFKYKQIKIDFDIYNNFKFATAAYSVNSNKKFTELTNEDYETINNFESFEDGANFDRVIFDEYSSDLKFTFNINIFKNRMLEDVNNFSEDDSPSLNELKCNITPGGETVFECIQECMKSSDTNNCNEKDCNEKCRNCMNLNVGWNVVDYNEQNGS